MSKARSILILGPTGAGKSSFIRKALESVGSGVVALAPGMDEYNSYAKMHDKAEYLFKGFDDTLFMPTIGMREATGLIERLKWQTELYKTVKAEVDAGRPLPYKLFAEDTASAMGTLVYNATLNKRGLDVPPAAQSPEGFAFYALLKQRFDELYRIPRALKGLGMHWISVSHVSEREITETANASVETKQKAIVAAIPGGFRDVLPSFFDLVFHAGVTAGQHYLRWKPNPKKPTKSRLGVLSEKDLIPNDWDGLMARLDKLEEEE